MIKLFYTSQSAYSEYSEAYKKSQEGFDLSDFVNKRQPMEITSDGVAIIHVSGVLTDDAPPIHSQLGGTDYQDIISESKAAVEAGAKGVLYYIQSGGGSVQGCIEAANIIQDLPIPSLTYYASVGCSAAFKLGCSTQWQVTRESSVIGNIGSIMVFADYSGLYEQMGIVVHALHNEGATLKSTFHDPKVSDEQLAFLQAEINKSGESFQNHVLENRPQISRECFDARWVSGQEQISLGLADEIGDEKTAYSRLLEIITFVS